MAVYFGCVKKKNMGFELEMTTQILCLLSAVKLRFKKKNGFEMAQSVWSLPEDLSLSPRTRVNKLAMVGST